MTYEEVLRTAEASAGNVTALVDEVRRLRSLPVIATCNGCARLKWRADLAEVALYECQHVRWPKLLTSRRIDDIHAVPPAWCPLRDPSEKT